MTKISDLIRRPVYKPPVIVIYGEPGVGKTTIGTTFPDPIFLNLEGSGLRASDNVDEIPITSVEEYAEAVFALKSELTSYKTLVIDTVDRLEEFASTVICNEMGIGSLMKASYGEGYFRRAELVNRLIDGAISVGMTTVFLAHAAVITVESPEVLNYHKSTIKLWVSSKGDRGTLPHLQEIADMIGYLAIPLSSDGARATVVSDQKRQVFVGTSPAHLSKIRVKDAPEFLPPDGMEIMKLFEEKHE